ncbi:tRNA lysidine(34) synthetase TilS [Pseudonocardia humida]|uniref:tRNA lysidine(34) synthetase TilS n=1 Tax=Pseudonocardia humida TaxID=2800819 RepID=UPI00207C8FAF|nr:tRNA lysidine(34) synthetase TilS [Pseudonocardia humida]
MTGGPTDAAVARVRRAVRTALRATPVDAGVPLLVACSGGADSTALAAAVAAVAGRRPVHAAVVDHALQDGSDARAAEAAERLAGLGIATAVHRVDVVGAGGVEAAARRARYAALRAARPHPDSPVLLGHTLDDQAETVLLGLGRGSGARSLAGMRTWDPPWLRPLLDVRRATTRAACAALGLPVWDDPHNADPRFTRVRLRHEVLPLLEEVLSGGVAGALARTAEQLREDADALDAVAATALTSLVVDTPEPDTLPLAPLGDLHPAVRRRVLRTWLAGRGVTGLTAVHLGAADVLAGRGPDRGGVALPGGLELVRGRGTLSLQTAGWSADRPPPHPREGSHRVRR